MSQGPAEELLDVHRDVTARTVAGVRWVLWLNLLTLPLSFATNVLLARMGQAAIGYYGAIQLFIGGFQSFFILGGNAVFTRLVPGLRRPQRVPFLAAYGGLVLAVCGAIAAAALTLAPGVSRDLLARFGSPGPAAALALAATVVVWAFTSHFLYAVLDARAAIVTLKSVVIGFFVAGWACFLFASDRLARDPAGVLWGVTLVVYAVAAALGVAFVVRTAEFRERGSLGPVFPRGFGSVVAYTYLQNPVAFVYAGLSSTIVLYSLDVGALGHLHAAMRYPVLVALLPAAMASVVSPGLSTLEASGLGAEALRKAGSAVRGALVVVAPAVYALVLLSEDAMGLFGPGYRGDRHVLAVLALSALAAPVVHLGSGLLIARGAFRAYLTASLVYVTASLALALVLIPRFGLLGAALATTGGEMVQQTCLSAVLSRRFGLRVGGRVAAAWGCGLVACAAEILLVPGRGLSLALLVAVLALFALTGRVGRQEAGTLFLRLLPGGRRERA